MIRCFDGALLEVEEPTTEPNPNHRAGTEAHNPAVEKVRRVIKGIGRQLDALLESTTLDDILHDRPIHYLITSESEFAYGEGI